jgi:hypothetical protein
MSTVAKAMAGNNVSYFKDILVRTLKGEGCNQIKHYVEHAQEDGMEPLWRAVLSTAKVCEDGAKATVRMSVLHPYDIDRMHSKLAEIKGPYNCDKYDSTNPGICPQCQYYKKVKNPLFFGTRVAKDNEVKEIDTTPIEQDDVAPRVSIQRPVPLRPGRRCVLHQEVRERGHCRPRDHADEL